MAHVFGYMQKLKERKLQAQFNVQMSKGSACKAYIYCLDLSMYSVLSILCGSVDDTSMTLLHKNREKEKMKMGHADYMYSRS